MHDGLFLKVFQGVKRIRNDRAYKISKESVFVPHELGESAGRKILSENIDQILSLINSLKLDDVGMVECAKHMDFIL